LLDNAFWLTNARLETGYHYENGIVTGTKTEPFHLRIEKGKVYNP